MTIEITRPETEALIQRCLESGQFVDIDQLLSEALGALQQKNPQGSSTSRRRRAEGRMSLAELFARSPFKGLNIEFDESAGGTIDWDSFSKRVAKHGRLYEHRSNLDGASDV